MSTGPSPPSISTGRDRAPGRATAGSTPPAALICVAYAALMGDQLDLAGVAGFDALREVRPAFVDVMFRLQNRDTARMMSSENVRSIRIEVPDIRDIDGILEAAFRAGAPKGSSRSGIFEIQTDDGIWMRDDGEKIHVDTKAGRAAVVFRTWDDLEARPRRRTSDG